ncbi:MAG: tyrosine-protein phosphatase [Candidatus Obscuribacterales bacterium]|nr:tyrosine-protein phosphatase [Candidatus Obscuribacterales bacterium]
MQRLGLLLACLLTINCPATAGEDDDRHRSRRHRHSHYVNGIRNFRAVHPWLFRGGKPPPQAFETINKMGVTTVVDLRDSVKLANAEKVLCKRYGMKFVHIPMSHRVAPTKQQIDEFLKVVAIAKEHTGKGSVFVHCTMGDDRTGCMVAISRMAQDGYTFDEAFEEMLHFGFHRHFDTLASAVREYAVNHNKMTSK